MTRMGIRLTLAAAILMIAVQPVLAQTAPPPATPGAPAVSNPPPVEQEQRLSSPRGEKVVDGPVKKVDPASKSVEVGGFLGFFRTRLAVTDDTQIAVEGGKGSLADIREGDRVKASYEARDGQNIAKSIEVIPADIE